MTSEQVLTGVAVIGADYWDQDTWCATSPSWGP